MIVSSQEKNGSSKALRGVALRVMEFAKKTGEGKPFSTCELAHLGKRAALDQALSRLTRAGTLARVRRGMYVLPRVSGIFGVLPPSAKDVLAAVGRATGEVFEASPEAALSALRLTTQNQLGRTYSTTGPSRTLRMSHMQPIHLKTAPKRNAVAPLMGSMAGAAAIGLLHLGRNNVDSTVVENVKRGMPPEEFDKLLSAARRMPAWLADALLHDTCR